jgi:hypothetical protein
MSMMKGSVSIGFLAFACAVATTAHADNPDVVAMHATFITNSNGKDQDPNLDLKVFNNKNVLIAENKGITGSWSDNSIDSISLDLKTPIKQADLSSGKIELDIHPAGKDKWDFNYNLSVTYSDNSVIWERWNGKELTQDHPTTSDALTGK